jgi:hypothetical protein
MPVGYSLVNYSKKEKIIFLHLPVNTMNEIMENDASNLIVRFYKQQNAGDEIDFVSDTYNDWPFSGGDKSEITTYKEITEEIVSALLRKGLIVDLGIEYQDEDEPDNIYIRKLAINCNRTKVFSGSRGPCAR